MDAPFNWGRVFGDTEQPKNEIKKLFQNAKFVPVCALGCYYSVYSDNTYSVKIAEFNYLNPTKNIPKIARDEFKPFGSFFTIQLFVPIKTLTFF